MKSSIILVVYVTIYAVGALQVNDTCITPCKKPGQCVPWYSCHYFRDKLRKSGNAGSIASYLGQSKCGVSSESETLTCCPRPFNPAGCGVVNTTKQSRAGDPIPYVFPWNGLLVYDTIDDNVLVPTCAATLITSQFMLTSARCSKDLDNSWILRSVRFERDRRQGDYALFNNLLLQEYDINKIFLHPKYSRTGTPDIAVLLLSDEVHFNEYVRPICIMLGRVDYYSLLTVTGWPQSLAASSTKELHGGSQLTCTDIDKEPNYAGSGGALMKMVDSVWYQVAVVGFESNDCPANNFAEFHTAVADYLTWIEAVVNRKHC